MTDPSQFSERDLLIRISTQLENMAPRLVEVERKIAALELRAASQGGMLSGAKLLYAFLATLPVGLIAYIFGNK